MGLSFLLVVVSFALLTIGGALWLFRHPGQAFGLLLLLLPFHTVVVRVLSVELGLSASASLLLQSWKEGILFLLLAWVVMRTFLTSRLRLAHSWTALLSGFFVATGVFALINSPNLLLGAYAFRGTFEPLAVLFLTLALPIDAAWVKRWLPRLLVGSGIIAVWAIIQVFVWGPGFLWKYYAVDGRLGTSFLYMSGEIQRAMGTFASPNQLSLYLSFMSIIVINLAIRVNHLRRQLYLLLTLLVVALLLSISRSGWAAFLAGMGFSLLIRRRRRKVILLILIVVAVIVPIALLLGLDRFIERTLQGEEISANYHIHIWRDNIEMIQAHPLGIGLGRVGARPLRFTRILGNGERVYTESYWLQTALELGVVGLFLLIVLVVVSGAVIYQNICKTADGWLRSLVVSALSCLIAAVVHGLLIPDLQDLTLGMYLWFLVGLGMRLPALEYRSRPAHLPYDGSQ